MDINTANADVTNAVMLQVDQPDKQADDPNDLFEGDIKTYTSSTLVIIDAVDPDPKPGDNVRTRTHRRNCRSIEDTFKDITDFGIVKISLPAGSTEGDFFNAIHEVLKDKAEKDMVIWHYQGSAGGVDEQYRWIFEGNPHGGINAYNFIELLCNSRPDSMLLLDCYIHDKLQSMWRLRTGNVELITLKCKIQNGAGRIVHDDDGGNLTEGVCRNLRRHLAHICELKRLGRDVGKPRSIPHICGGDYGIKSKSLRIWFSRTGKQHSNLCLRFMLIPQRLLDTKRIVFSGKCIGPPRPPQVVILPPQEKADDEGYEEGDDQVAGAEGVKVLEYGLPGAGADGAIDDNLSLRWDE